MARRPKKTDPVPEPARSPSAGKPKTAVVVIHGMGEQRPLETLREFVETVYQRDRRLAADARNTALLKVSIVPDDATGSAELRRITTHDDGPAKRTDFFEFYWADIMSGTPLEMVTSWVQAVLLRAPWRVPKSRRVWRAWLILWALAVVVILAAVTTVYSGALNPQPLGGWVDIVRWVLGGLLVAAGAGTFIHRLWTAGWTVEPVKLGVPLGLAVPGIVFLLMPSPLAHDIRFWAGVITAGVGWFMNFLVAPFLGDVVRYVRATPQTIERRRLVRDRGMALLESLHAKRITGDDVEDFTASDTDGDPYYDRIVIVGHSLGSVIAYDLLQHFWERHGPTHHVDWPASDAKTQTALKASDEFVAQAWATGGTISPAAFAASQEALRSALGRNAPYWRITDLITLGCPLVHAEFLLTDGLSEVDKAFVERRFASSPPRPDPISGTSMLYAGRGGETLYPHFAAQFAAVRWTNICDEDDNPLLGDLVSGRTPAGFGPGVIQFDDSITRPAWWTPFRRIFTHTEYWSWHPSYDAPNAVPAHIQNLRAALSLGT